MPKPYTHLSLEERALIQVWLEHNLSLRAIALKLRRAPSTITREFSRNTAQNVVFISGPGSMAAKSRIKEREQARKKAKAASLDEPF